MGLDPDTLVETMRAKAKAVRPRLVIAEGADERCLQAASELLADGICKLILFGDPKKIEEKAARLKVDVGKAEMHDFANSPLKGELAGALVERRRHKGMTREEALRLLDDENYFACMYVLGGHAEGLVGSAVCPTAALMRPALQLLRRPGALVSEITVAYDAKKGRTFFLSDGSLNMDPSPEDLSQIALNAASYVRALGLVPKVALLSFSTKGSGGDGPLVQPIRDAVALIKEKDPNLVVDGEMQVDAAINPDAARRKCPGSPLKGEANVLVFPNLTAANIFFHAMLQFEALEMAYTTLAGLAAPVGILGRSTSVIEKRNVMISVAAQAAEDAREN